MKIENSDGTIAHSNLEGSRTIKSGISQKAMKHITQILTRLYNDPESAVFREYVANALDAHTAAGSSEPIDILLPNEVTPIFTVSDTGVGMSSMDMELVYSQYGESTKNNSNDEIGGFGLGCKSALAIATQFTIISVKDGISTHAIYANGEDGQPELEIISETQVEKPNGTTIMIPVKNVHSFNNKAHNYFRFMKPESFTVAGVQFNEYYQDFLEDYLVNLRELGDDCTVRSYRHGYHSPINSGVYLVMGGIVYTIPFNDIMSNVPDLQDFPKRLVSSVFDSITVIECPIASVQLSPNREGIQFTKKTQEFFSSIFLESVKTFQESLVASIEDAETFKEAMAVYKSYDEDLRRLVPDNWNGLTLNARGKVYLPYSVLRAHYDGWDEKSSSQLHKELYIDWLSDSVFIKGDKTDRSFMSYASAYLKAEISTRYIFYIKDDLKINTSSSKISRMIDVTDPKTGNTSKAPDPEYFTEDELELAFPDKIKVIEFSEYKDVANQWRKDNKPKITKAARTVLDTNYNVISTDKKTISSIQTKNLDVSTFEQVYYFSPDSRNTTDEMFNTRSGAMIPAVSEALLKLYGDESIIIRLSSSNTVDRLNKAMKLIGVENDPIEVDVNKIFTILAKNVSCKMDDVLGYFIVNESNPLLALMDSPVVKDIKDPKLRKLLDRDKYRKVSNDFDTVRMVPKSFFADGSKSLKIAEDLKILSSYRWSHDIYKENLVEKSMNQIVAKYPLAKAISFRSPTAYEHFVLYLNTVHRSDKTPAFTIKA